MIVIGLDISSTTTGIAVLKDGILVYTEAVQTQNRNKFPDVFSVAEHVKESLKKIADNYNIDQIYVEENLKSFSSGFSSAGTIIKLAKINALICYMAYKQFDILPVSIMPSTARKNIGIKIPKGTKGNEAKKFILDWVCENEPSFTYELTKAGNPKPGTYDRADAYVIARAGEEIAKSQSKNT